MSCCNCVRILSGEDLKRILQKRRLTLDEYLQFLASIEESTSTFRDQQQTAFKAERESWKELGLAEYVSEHETAKASEEDELPLERSAVRCSMPGSVWKVLVEPGQEVKKGETLIIEESMKMEFTQPSPCDGFVSAIFVKPGDEVHAGQLIVGIVKERKWRWQSMITVDYPRELTIDWLREQLYQ